MTFRCSAASALDDEPLAGTAPTERALLFVEYAGAWGRDAPALLAEHVTVPAGVRPQLVRRGRATHGVRVFAAWRAGDGFHVETTVLDSLTALAGLDLDALAAGRSPGLTPHHDALWLVCTNGRRDLCCAEQGRPVFTALAREWPDHVWETTHLGGHRFAATLLALPSGQCLGRLDAVNAVDTCRALLNGKLLEAHARGRAGRPGAAQAAELHLPGATAVAVQGQQVELDHAGDRWVVEIAEEKVDRRQSCGDEKVKPATTYRVVAAERS